MNEDTVKGVMTAYFIQKQVNAHPTGKGEKGPDFYIDGTAVEVKEAKFDSERLMEQLVTYTVPREGSPPRPSNCSVLCEDPD